MHSFVCKLPQGSSLLNMKKEDINILIGCEESQIVTQSFRDLGFNAFSCDLISTSGCHPEWHLKMDIFEAIEKIKPALLIAFPPCTDLTKACANKWKEKQANGNQQKAIDFVLKLYNSKCQNIAIENPVGILSTVFKKPDQIIHPFYFGDPYKKMTCIWLKGLPKLIFTNIVKPEYNWHSGSIGYKNKEGVRIRPETKPTTFTSGKLRSKTFSGIAKAMAEQWGAYIENQLILQRAS